MISSGSPAKTGVPSGAAKRSPVKCQVRRDNRKTQQECQRTAPESGVINFFLFEPEMRQVIESLFEPGGDQKVASLREPADGELERSNITGLARREIARRHGELVQVGIRADMQYLPL